MKVFSKALIPLLETLKDFQYFLYYTSTVLLLYKPLSESIKLFI